MEGSKEYLEVLQSRLDWCVDREYYEMAAKLRDLLEYERTDSQECKNEYHIKLLEKYTANTPEYKEYIEKIKKRYNIQS